MDSLIIKLSNLVSGSFRTITGLIFHNKDRLHYPKLTIKYKIYYTFKNINHVKYDFIIILYLYF